MDTVNRPFPWDEMMVILLQLVGILSGIAILAVAVVFGVSLLAQAVVAFASSISHGTARIARVITIATIVVAPPLVAYFWLTSAGCPSAFTIPGSLMVLSGSVAIGAVATSATRNNPVQPVEDTNAGN